MTHETPRVPQAEDTTLPSKKTWFYFFALYRNNVFGWRKWCLFGNIKGTVVRDFRLQVFLWISFPQAHEYTIRAVSNFFQKFAEIFAAQGAPPVSLTSVANEKNFNQKTFNYFLEHLCVVELALVDKFFSSWKNLKQNNFVTLSL